MPAGRTSLSPTSYVVRFSFSWVPVSLKKIFFQFRGSPPGPPAPPAAPPGAPFPRGGGGLTPPPRRQIRLMPGRPRAGPTDRLGKQQRRGRIRQGGQAVVEARLHRRQ